MFNTIYRLRLSVEETHQFFPIHLCALKEKEPTFNDLLKKVERITEKKLDLNDFYLATVDSNVALYDNQSLHTALKISTSAEHQSRPLEITLCRRSNSNKKPLDDLHLRSNNNQQPTKAPVRTKVPTIIHLQPINSSSPATTTILPPPPPQPMAAVASENVPVIKPTVLRWTPAISPASSNDNHTSTISNVRRYSSISQNDQSIGCRKDSGVSLDEPHTHYRKKQRVMSADHPRKLPDLSSSPLLLSSIRNNSITSLHPLEIRRPSTAPPSCSPPNSPFPRPQRHQQQNYVPPTLPAISSITSSTSHSQILDPQLAPIQFLAAKPPTLFYQHPHSSSSSHHVNPNTTSMKSVKQQSHHQQTNTNNKIPRSAVASAVAVAVNNANISTTTSANNLFLCEHRTDHGKVCGQTFRRSYDLSRHQTIHLENRPFCYCNQCGKKFTRMDALRRHERVQGHTSGLAAKQQHRSMSVVTTATLNLPSMVQQRKTSV